MKKPLVLLCILAIPCASFSVEQKTVTKNNEFGGETIVYQFKPGEHQMLSRKTDYGDINGAIRKIEVEFNQKTVDESGIVRQVEFYNGKFVERYEIFYSNQSIARAGIDRSLEFMEPNDVVSRIEYYYRGKLLYMEDGKAASMGYRPALIGYYNAMVLSMYSKNRSLTKDFFGYEATNFKSKSVVTYCGRIEAMDEKDVRVISGFFKMRKGNDVSNLYSRKVQVEENGVKYWVLIQDKVMEHIQKLAPKSRILLLYYYIGSYNDRIILAGIDYYDL